MDVSSYKCSTRISSQPAKRWGSTGRPNSSNYIKLLSGRMSALRVTLTVNIKVLSFKIVQCFGILNHCILLRWTSL
ncbi:hypothetical protein F0562_000587 [Nyssa sinensis]|uniref:Uncharacterized protein n=1 Tax=Nyssa sinensis TaxID=561372 RepID=A0A5J5C0H3_9ASTE|nr:hypothetical protein F0562_000587 [Nyssa sinensis]